MSKHPTDARSLQRQPRLRRRASIRGRGGRSARGRLTILTGISEDVVTVMSEYAHFYNRVGATDEGDGFPASARSGIDGSVNTLCQTPLGGYLQATAPHVGDIFDPTFAAEMLACINGGGPDGGVPDAGGADGGDAGPGCVDPGLSYYNFMSQNFLTADSSGPLVPVVSPVQAPEVNGQSAFGTLNGVGLTPTISWQPPAIGTPTAYDVKVFDIATMLLASSGYPVNGIVTTSTSVVLPLGLLKAGESYGIIITAVVSPIDASTKPFHMSSSFASADAVSGVITP